MSLYENIIVYPLHKLYIYGPNVMQIGFWGGQPKSQICQSITTYSEVFWQQNLPECEDLIENKFTAFRVTVEISLYFFVLYQLTKGISFMCLLFCCRCRHLTSQPDTPPSIIYLSSPPTISLQPRNSHDNVRTLLPPD
jgi:hypothetical protein